MVNISTSELKKLDNIGSGNFGTVYRRDNKAFKVYSKLVKADYGELVKNPMLKNRLFVIQKLKRLIYLGKKLNHNSLIDDLLYIDDNFAGIVMPYYCGKRLFDLKDEKLSKRIEISRLFIESAKELTQHYVYPTDYKLINAILDSDEVKIIDLDDVFTKVRFMFDPVYNRESIIALDETIKAFFNESRYEVSCENVGEFLSRETEHYNKDYSGIERYINMKSQEYSYVYIDETTNLENSLNFVGNRKCRVVFVLKDKRLNDNELCLLLKRLKEKNIHVYDLVRDYLLSSYINDTIYDENIMLINSRK